MISISRLLCGGESFGDSLRYCADADAQRHGTSAGRGPVVVWNCTQSCNLHCMHCYTGSDARKYPNELSTDEAEHFIDDLAEFRVPVLLISGGEPLIRHDILGLAEYAAKQGVRVTFSTNGTLINDSVAKRMKSIEIGYVGISFDGIGATHDYFRGRTGAFEESLRGLRACLRQEQKVGVRFTINRHNYREIDAVFDMVEREGVPRICFYHLVYSGRGAQLRSNDLTHDEKRAAIDRIMERTEATFASGAKREVLTVDNHADGIYAYLRLAKRNDPAADDTLALLRRNGGNRSGIAIACVDSAYDVVILSWSLC